MWNLLNKEPSYQKYTTNPIDAFLTSKSRAPSSFFVVCVALTTTTCSSSECRPDGEAEATSRFVALCGAKQGPQGFVADPKKPATFPEQRCRVHVRQDLSSCESEPCSAKKKAGRFRVLTYLPWGVPLMNWPDCWGPGTSWVVGAQSRGLCRPTAG